jgi:hypothetical protein
MKQSSLWHVPLLSGLVLGLVLGLVYTWIIDPVQFYNTAPDRLREDLKQEYIILIGDTYAADGDWSAAQERLADLGDPDIAHTVLRLTEQAIADGRPVATVRHLAVLAGQLGASSPAVAAFVPTRSIRATPTSVAVIATFTPAPATPSPTPTTAPTPSPMPTIRPTATPVLLYRLLTQQRICEPDREQPLLQVVVRDATGDEIPGAEILVTWGEQTERLFTGLKPELGLGYADLVMRPETTYAVQLAHGSEAASGIHASACNSSNGPRLLSTRLIFERITP